MSDIATFFRHRTNDPGETYRFEIGSSLVSVYSRNGIVSDLTKLLQQENQELALKDLRNLIGNEGGGGWIVSATDDESGRKLTVARITGKTFDPAKSYVLLSPGRKHVPFDVDGKSQKVPLNSHAIVPVDEEAMAALTQFLGYLEWLSPDLESHVLNAIRRPSIESRLDKLERHAFGRTASEGMHIGRLRGAMRSFLSPIGYRAAAVVFVVLVLGATGLWYRRSHAKIVTPPDTSTLGITQAAATDTKQTDVKQPEPYISEVKKLLTALRGKRNNILSKLYEKQFKELENKSDDDMKALFQTYKKGSNENRAFLWGLIKLQALKLKPELLAERLDRLPFLTTSERVDATKELFRQIGNPTIDSDGDGLFLLAVLSCRLGYETPVLDIGLPDTTPASRLDSQEPVIPNLPVVFIRNGDCINFPETRSERGLKALKDWVEQQP